MKNDRGAVLILFALLIPLAIAFVGMSIDYSRLLRLKVVLANAADAAAFAVAKQPELSTEEAEQVARRFIDTHLAVLSGPDNQPSFTFELSRDLSLHSLSPTTTSEIKKTTVEVTGTLNTTFLRIFTMFGLSNPDSLQVTMRAEVVPDTLQIEIVLALDNTGSMEGSKIAELKTAATLLVNNLFGDSENANFVSVALVPFSEAVNIGNYSIESETDQETIPWWIDKKGESSIYGDNLDLQDGETLFDLFNKFSNETWNGCVRARTSVTEDQSIIGNWAGLDTDDTPPSINNPDTLWVPYFAPDEPDCLRGRTGCSTLDYANNYMKDWLDIGWPEEIRQSNTKKYDLATVSWPRPGPNHGCPAQPVLPLSSNKQTVLDSIEAMTARGSTVIPQGLVWAWRTLSPGEPFVGGADYNDRKTIKIIVLLTDGRNDVTGNIADEPHEGINKSYYSSYGFASQGYLGNPDGTESAKVLNKKTEIICDNIKQKNIRLYTITFQVTNEDIIEIMRDCASDPGNFYAPNSDLSSVFAEIARDFNELRLAR